MSLEQALDQLQSQLGQETHVSDWVDVTQQRVNAFADATSDHQWIHVDPVRAASESPYGGAIAHGYLTLSLYPMLRGLVDESRPLLPGVQRVINYGINKLRFPNAVKVGARVRARCTLAAVEPIAGGLQIVENVSIEVENEAKPACVAELIMRLYF
jgi:acyl dehydratase